MISFYVIWNGRNASQRRLWQFQWTTLALLIHVEVIEALTVLETDLVWQYEICVAFWKSLFLMQFKAHLWYMWRLGDSDSFCFCDDQILCILLWVAWKPRMGARERESPFTVMCLPLVCSCTLSDRVSVWSNLQWASQHISGTIALMSPEGGLFVLTAC